MKRKLVQIERKKDNMYFVNIWKGLSILYNLDYSKETSSYIFVC